MLEIVPHANFSQRSEYTNLIKNIENCTRFRFSIAFFTDLLKNNRRTHSIFKEKLRGDSYVLVDLEKPTDFEYLSKLKDEDCNVFFCKPRIVGKDDKLQRLMHTKIYLFEFDDVAEIWVGSMNFTQAGILGENLECTMKFRCSMDDARYLEISDYLEYIKSIQCDPFPVNGLQRDVLRLFNGRKTPQLWRLHGKKRDAIFLFTNDFKNIDKIEFIQLFFVQKNVENFRKDEEFIVYLYDTNSRTHFCAEATITQIGDIEQNATELAFLNDKPFAIAFDEKPNYLFNEMKFNRYKKIPEIKSFLTLKINWLSTKTNVYDLIENKNMFRIQENDERVRVLDLDGLIVEPEILRIDHKFEIGELFERIRTLIEFFSTEESHLSNRLSQTLDLLQERRNRLKIKHPIIIKDDNYRFTDFMNEVD